MRAVLMETFGEPEVLRLVDVPAPRPAAGELVVNVEAVSINRSFDLLARRDGNNRNIVLPHVLGADPAGTVATVGDGVEEFSPGRPGCRRGPRPSSAASAANAPTATKRPAARRSIWAFTAGAAMRNRSLAPAASVYRIPDGISAAEGKVILDPTMAA